GRARVQCRTAGRSPRSPRSRRRTGRRHLWPPLHDVTMTRCPYCGEDLTLALEIWGHEWSPQICCERLQAECDLLDQEDWLAMLRSLSCGAVRVRGLTEDLDLDFRIDGRLLAG